MSTTGARSTRRAPSRIAPGPDPGARPGPSASNDPEILRRGSLLPFVGVGVLFALVAVTLHLSSVLRNTLEDELAARLRISAQLVASELTRDGLDEFDPEDPGSLARVDDIRRATNISEIAFYDATGSLVGGASSEASMGPAVPRTIRIGTAQGRRSADPRERLPERDLSGGLTLLVPLGEDAGGGALMTRIEPDAQGGLPAIDFLFQVAKALAGIITAAGFLILVRWITRGGDVTPRMAPAAPASDVGMVLGTVKEVMTTLKDSELEYRDRWTAAEADADTERRRSDVILESITSALVAFDPAGRITLFNRAAERLLGMRERNVLGRSLAEVFASDDPIRAFGDGILEDLRAPRRTEVARTGADGEVMWLAVIGSVVRDARRVSQGGVLLLEDVTETRNLREAAGLKDRLSAVGEMSAGIAHEIKNALHSLMGHANLLREDHGGEESLPVRGILEEVRTLESMVKGILEFSRPARLVRVSTDLNEMIEESVASARERSETAGVEVRLDLEAGLPTAQVDAAALKQVILNFVLNAVEAMEDGGGSLTVATRAAEVPVQGERRQSGLRLSFKDTGPGIPEADRTRIFTPFYTTKREGHGLGLALAHRTITDHGGRLALHSREGVGTEFVILLPLGEA